MASPQRSFGAAALSKKQYKTKDLFLLFYISVIVIHICLLPQFLILSVIKLVLAMNAFHDYFMRDVLDKTLKVIVHREV